MARRAFSIVAGLALLLGLAVFFGTRADEAATRADETAASRREQPAGAARDPSHGSGEQARTQAEDGREGERVVGKRPLRDGGGHVGDRRDDHRPEEHGRAHDGGHDGHGHGPGRHATRDERQAGARRLGQELRDFTLTDSGGGTLQLRALRRTTRSRGQIAVLTFWCTTCHSCRIIERDFDQKAKQYVERGVRFSMVDSNATDSAQRVREFLHENALGFPVLMDAGSEMARYFGATRTTTTAVIDTEGRLRYYGGFAGAEAAVRNLLAGEDVAVPESPGGG